MRLIAVEIKPVRNPAAVSAVERNVDVVVFPSVPVTPIEISSSAGSLSHQAAAMARAARASRTTTSGTLLTTCRSLSTTAAPCSAALSINVAPSTLRPGIATNTPPRVTCRESCVGALVMAASIGTGSASSCRALSRATRSLSRRSLISDPLALGQAVNADEVRPGATPGDGRQPWIPRWHQRTPYARRARTSHRPQLGSRDVPLRLLRSDQ